MVKQAFASGLAMITIVLSSCKARHDSAVRDSTPAPTPEDGCEGEIITGFLSGGPGSIDGGDTYYISPPGSPHELRMVVPEDQLENLRAAMTRSPAKTTICGTVSGTTVQVQFAERSARSYEFSCFGREFRNINFNVQHAGINPRNEEGGQVRVKLNRSHGGEYREWNAEFIERSETSAKYSVFIEDPGRSPVTGVASDGYVEFTGYKIYFRLRRNGNLQSTPSLREVRVDSELNLASRGELTCWSR